MNRTQRRLRSRLIAERINEQNADPCRTAAREHAEEARIREGVEQRKRQEARPPRESLHGRAKRELAELDAWLAIHSFDEEHIAWLKGPRCDRAMQKSPDNPLVIYASNGLTPWLSSLCSLYLYQTNKPEYRKFGISKDPDERARTCASHERPLYIQRLATYEAPSRAVALLIEESIAAVWVEGFISREITEMDASEFLKHCKDRAQLIEHMGIREYMKVYEPVWVRLTATDWVHRRDPQRTNESKRDLALG